MAPPGRTAAVNDDGDRGCAARGRGAHCQGPSAAAAGAARGEQQRGGAAKERGRPLTPVNPADGGVRAAFGATGARHRAP